MKFQPMVKSYKNNQGLFLYNLKNKMNKIKPSLDHTEKQLI